MPAGLPLLALLLVAVSSACGGSKPGVADRLRPIDDERVATTTSVTTPPTRPQGSTASTTTTSATAATTALPPQPGVGSGDRRAVDDLLERYDRALTDLAATPDAVNQPGHPALVAWNNVVNPGTVLAEDLPAAIAARRAAGVVVRPGAGGLSYRHRSIELIPAPDGSLSFTWCSWSPGIGYDVATGGVVDDGVGHAHGTGRARIVDGRWAVDALDQSDLEVLPPGAADPCPAEVVRVVGR